MKKLFVILLSVLILLGGSACGEAKPAVLQAQPTAATDVPKTPEPTPEPTPTAEPTEAPTPTPEPTEEPTPTPEPTKDPNRPMVALTFDDGPNLKLTVPVLDKLEQYHVKATFYVLCSAINETTGPMLQRMVDQGCEIGLHGLTHELMTNFTSEENTRRHLRACDIISGWIEGGYQIKTLRPPGGSNNAGVARGAKDAGLAVIIWSVDTLDWYTQNVAKIMDVVKKETKNGAIILCHDHHQPTLDALDEMIPWLLEQGYDLVTVSELLESTGKPIEPGKVYFQKEFDD